MTLELGERQHVAADAASAVNDLVDEDHQEVVQAGAAEELDADPVRDRRDDFAAISGRVDVDAKRPFSVRQAL